MPWEQEEASTKLERKNLEALIRKTMGKTRARIIVAVLVKMQGTRPSQPLLGVVPSPNHNRTQALRPMEASALQEDSYPRFQTGNKPYNLRSLST